LRGSFNGPLKFFLREKITLLYEKHVRFKKGATIMKGIAVCDIPGKRKHRLRKFLDDFMLTRTKHFEVLYDEGEYSSTLVASKCLAIAVKTGKYPIQVSYRNGRVFLTRTDM
jgi:hypothetical protein